MNHSRLPLAVSALALTFLFAGCQTTTTDTTTTTTQTTQATTETKKPSLSVYQVNDDGSSEQITNITQQTSSTPPPMVVVPNLKGISIGPNGFVPDSITIKAGTTVRFINVDDAPHWPASDPHPAHTLCPGFDAKKALAKDESYEFTFTEAKTCTFHDHLNPTTKGTIIVQ